MDANVWLTEIRASYAQQKRRSERAAAQIEDADFLTVFGHTGHSAAILMKHMAGNLRSRWRDFLTTDGEKQDRDRETEFSSEGETRASIEAHWDAGWTTALAALEALRPDDLDASVTIRGQHLSVAGAILRNLAHVAYHGGQLVQLARHWAGDDWTFLSVPPGESERYNASMRAEHGDWWEADASR